MAAISLPWFPEGDPLLPEYRGLEVLPLQRHYGDHYQTYDALFVVGLPEDGREALLPFRGGNLVDPVALMPLDPEHPYAARIWLIDRFTPWVYPWASGYAANLYAVIDYYYGFPEIGGPTAEARLAAGLSPSQITTGETEITLAAQETTDPTVITWLEPDLEVNSLHKRYQLLKPSTTKETTHKMVAPNGVCAFSVVVSGSQAKEVEQQLRQDSAHLLWRDFDYPFFPYAEMLGDGPLPVGKQVTTNITTITREIQDSDYWCWDIAIPVSTIYHEPTGRNISGLDEYTQEEIARTVIGYVLPPNFPADAAFPPIPSPFNVPSYRWWRDANSGSSTVVIPAQIYDQTYISTYLRGGPNLENEFRYVRPATFRGLPFTSNQRGSKAWVLRTGLQMLIDTMDRTYPESYSVAPVLVEKRDISPTQVVTEYLSPEYRRNNLGCLTLFDANNDYWSSGRQGVSFGDTLAAYQKDDGSVFWMKYLGPVLTQLHESDDSDTFEETRENRSGLVFASVVFLFNHEIEEYTHFSSTRANNCSIFYSPEGDITGLYMPSTLLNTNPAGTPSRPWREVQPFAVNYNEYNFKRVIDTYEVTHRQTSAEQQPIYEQISIGEALNVLANFWSETEADEETGSLELVNQMADSIRLKEIHQALEAGFFGNGAEKISPGIDQIMGTPDEADSLLSNLATDRAFELKYTTLVGFLQLSNFSLWALAGLHNYPLVRVPTYKPFDDQGARESEPQLLMNLVEHLSKNDFETQAKLGLWPMVTYNYAKLDDADQPEPALYTGIADVLGDQFALDTRNSVMSERAALSAFRADHHVIELFKAVGSPVRREERDWDYGVTDLIVYNGALSIVGAMMGYFAEEGSEPTDLLPTDITEEIRANQLRILSNSLEFAAVTNDRRDLEDGTL